MKEYKRGWYESMLLSGKLDSHLMGIEIAAKERMDVLMSGLLEKYPAPDKEKDQMVWAAHVNSLREMAEKTVLDELVYS